MSNNNRKAPADRIGYEIGYGRTPQQTRFRPGQSGNPAGRRKGVRNLGTDVRRILKVPVKVKESGRSRKISTQEGALMLLREKALKSDARALDRLLELASRFNNEPDETELQTLGTDDRSILAAYAAEIATASTPTPAQSSKHQRIKLRRRPS
jgi:hypothetical protein